MQKETFKVLSAQSIFDIALTTYGSVEGAIDLLVLNNLDIDSTLPSALEYEVQDNHLVRYLSGISIATEANFQIAPFTPPAYVNTGNGDKESTSYTPSLAKTHLVKSEQNIFDIVCMITGSMEDVVDIMLLNGIDFSSNPTVGTKTKYEGDMFTTEEIATGATVQAATGTGAFNSGFNNGFL